PATRSPARSASWTSCPGPDQARFSSVSCGPRSGPATTSRWGELTVLSDHGAWAPDDRTKRLAAGEVGGGRVVDLDQLLGRRREVDVGRTGRGPHDVEAEQVLVDEGGQRLVVPAGRDSADWKAR